MLLRWTQPNAYNPWREFRALQRQMDRVFHEMSPAPTSAAPAFNVADHGDHYLVEAELPGVGHDDLSLDATATSLTIKGKRNVTAPQGYATHRSERSTLEFSRAFTFESRLDLEKVRADLSHGLLRIELHKQELDQPRTITVKVR